MTTRADSRLRFLVCGNVDDGKSTLIGRLLVDTDSLFIDQLEDLKKTSQVRQNSEDANLMNFALVTDGLKSEREQGITIDVAYRFFNTERRSFCIIDVPGHAQYLRNMFTGATNADVAIILVDVKNGISEQTRRHLLILSLVGLKQIIVAINKMDAINYDEKHFLQFKIQVEKLTEGFQLKNLIFVPLSSLRGDNLITRSDKMTWYQGPPLLSLLENFQLKTEKSQLTIASVQGVIRVGDDRHYMLDQISGQFKIGDMVTIFPQETKATLKTVSKYHAMVGEDFDIERGSLMVLDASNANPYDQVRANICWFTSAALKKAPYLFSFCGNNVRCNITNVVGEFDLQSGLLNPKQTDLVLNDLVQVEIKLSKPLLTSTYRENAKLGSFLIIDPLTNNTVAAGMIL